MVTVIMYPPHFHGVIDRGGELRTTMIGITQR
jgi:hypothetical protein